MAVLGFKSDYSNFTLPPENIPLEYNSKSKRHICFLAEDIDKARQLLKENEIEIVADSQPITGWERFYFRDPAGNRIEFAQISN